jgi:hypothetical protein
MWQQPVRPNPGITSLAQHSVAHQGRPLNTDTQGAISKLEHSDDVRVLTLRQYLEALGARLELVAVFDDEDRRVPVHLGKDSAA